MKRIKDIVAGAVAALVLVVAAVALAGYATSANDAATRGNATSGTAIDATRDTPQMVEVHDQNAATWTNATAAMLRGGGSTTLGTPGTQTISGVCAEVPTAGGVATRTGLWLQVLGGSTTIRCGVNADCATPQLNVLANGALTWPFTTKLYCDTASGSASIGQVEYK